MVSLQLRFSKAPLPTLLEALSCQSQTWSSQTREESSKVFENRECIMPASGELELYTGRITHLCLLVLTGRSPGAAL